MGSVTSTTVRQLLSPSYSWTPVMVPDSIRDKVGPLPDMGTMNKDDLSALCMKLYEQSCAVFQEKWNMEVQVKKRDAEIHNLEAECCDTHGTFKIPKLKKVNKFKTESDE